MTSPVLELPSDVLLLVGTFLPKGAVVTLASCNRIFRFLLCNDWLWRTLCVRDGLTELAERADAAGVVSVLPRSFTSSSANASTALRRYQIADFLARAPIVSRVELSNRRRMPEREAHAQCILRGRVFVRGGFVDDDDGWFVAEEGDVRVRNETGDDEERGFPHVYGHHMTALSETEAVLFGGCRSGGYSNMSSKLALMRLDPEDDASVHPTFRDVYCFQMASAGEHHERPLVARAYHGQCLATIGGVEHLVIAGGLLEDGEHEPLDVVHAIPTRALLERPISREWIVNAVKTIPCTGDVPRPRFSMSLVYVPSAKVLIASGGYTGTGMYARRDGEDLTDINSLCLETQVWRRIVDTIPIRGVLGRCHTANVFGPCVVFFGGTVRLSRKLAIFDTRSGVLTIPSTSSTTGVSASVQPRLAHCASIVGAKLIVTGGWCQERTLKPIIIDLSTGFLLAASEAVLESDFEAAQIVERALGQRPLASLHLGAAEDKDGAVDASSGGEDAELYEPERRTSATGTGRLLQVLLAMHAQVHPGAPPTMGSLTELMGQHFHMLGTGWHDGANDSDEEEDEDDDVHDDGDD